MALNPLLLEEIVRRALIEDIEHGDLTTDATVPEDLQATAVTIVKENGVFCGHPVAEMVWKLLDSRVRYTRLLDEGSDVTAGTVVARLHGPAHVILTGERVALNLVQRTSGIATVTRRLSDAIKYYKAKLVETRKTVPGLRLLDKYAVRVGGGANHRYGLADAVLIKDNHIAICGSIKAAVLAARRAAPFTARIEVEVEDLAGVDEALAAGADIILLDNMDTELLKQAVEMVAGRAILEASGKITADNLDEVARTGVDYISMGALTHSVKALDISMDVVGTGDEEATA